MSRAAGYAFAAAVLLATGACAPKQESATTAPVADAAFDPQDLGGTWDRFPLAGTEPAAGVPLPVPIPPPPLKPEFQAAYDAEQKLLNDAAAAGEPIANNYTHCIPDGMPAMMMNMFPMEILQTEGQVTIIQEAYNQIRRIYLGYTLPAVEDAEPGFWGHSTGKWEGDEFVVETIGIKEHVRFRGAPHSPSMRIHERMRKIDANHFVNAVTVEDPEYLTGPWSWTWVHQRRPDYKMYEYVCEDNREFADPVTGKQRLRIDSQ